jgi:hypothetical protein
MNSTNGHAPALPAISPDVAHERGYVRIQSERQLSAYTQSLTLKQQQIPGLLIPVYQLGNPTPYEHVLRPDKPRIDDYTGKPIKYEWPARVPLVLDVLPCYREALQDPTIPIWITEGAKKADALASAFGPSIVPMNINGVWAWKHPHKDGSSHPLDDFDQVAWNGRQVVLAFDNDVVRNPKVQKALRALRGFLKTRDATVRVLVLPDDGEKIGVDDALAGGMTADELLSLVHDDLPQPAAEPQPRRYLTEDEIDLLNPPTWLIKGVMPAGEVTLVSGPGDAGKTFIVTDMMKRVAQHYPVMYGALEDAPGIRIRKRAWELHYQLPKNGNFLMWTQALDLYDAVSVDSFIAEVVPLGLRMITLDTLSRALGGADENSNTDIAIVMNNCERIAHQTGAAVVLIHHTTKDGAAFRGASALKNNTYGHLEISRDDDLIQFKIGCIKNTPEAAPRYFKLVTVPIPDIIDDDGNQVSSAVILPADRVANGDKITGNQIKMLVALLDITDAQGGAATSDLEKASGLVGSSFYSALKRLRALGLVDKGDKQRDPITITAAGRARLSVESANPEHQSGGVTMNIAPPFEVNTRLNRAITPLLQKDSEGKELLQKDAWSNDVADPTETDPDNAGYSNVTPTAVPAPEAITPITPKLLQETNWSNELLTPHPLSPLGEGVWSNRDSNGLEHDLRRIAEITKALETGNIKAARKAAGDIRGRKEQKAADLRIDEYIAAQSTEEAAS